MRYAVVEYTNVGRYTTLKEVEAYLPDNYKASEISNPGSSWEVIIIIVGEDFAGWTLDGYVIPRLASGNIYARELVQL